jgi:predicted MFS family arabinose efflux permease
MLAGPWLGRLADAVGKFRMFAGASAIGAVWVLWYTRLGPSPLWLVMVANAFFALIIGSRMLSTMALISAVPQPHERGAYMAVGSSMQQLAGGVSAWFAGQIVVQEGSGRIANYPQLGWVVVACMAITVMQMRRVDRLVHGSAAAVGGPQLVGTGRAQ